MNGSQAVGGGLQQHCGESAGVPHEVEAATRPTVRDATAYRRAMELSTCRLRTACGVTGPW